MNVLMVISGLNYGGGTERVCSMIANGLSEAGYNIVLASVTPIDKPFFPLSKDINIISLSSFSDYRLLRILNTIHKIKKTIKEERIDIVIAVETMCVLFTAPATLGLSVKHIAWEHFNFNQNLGQKKRSIARQLAARYCDDVVTLTERDKNCWLKSTANKAKITAISNPSPFVVQEDVEKEDTKIVLAIGRLDYEKGYDLLLKSWIQVAKTKQDWRLKIVGSGKDREKLSKYIEKHQLADSVELVGKTDDVGKYYKQAEIFCLSSRFEGFGVVLIEALAFGLPIVSFDCDFGPAEILEGTGSILVPKGNTDKLASSLIELMNDDKLREAINIKSKKKAEFYQPDKILNQWITLIEGFK